MVSPPLPMISPTCIKEIYVTQGWNKPFYLSSINRDTNLFSILIKHEYSHYHLFIWNLYLNLFRACGSLSRGEASSYKCRRPPSISLHSLQIKQESVSKQEKMANNNVEIKLGCCIWPLQSRHLLAFLPSQYYPNFLLVPQALLQSGDQHQHPLWSESSPPSYIANIL